MDVDRKDLSADNLSGICITVHHVNPNATRSNAVGSATPNVILTKEGPPAAAATVPAPNVIPAINGRGEILRKLSSASNGNCPVSTGNQGVILSLRRISRRSGILAKTSERYWRDRTTKLLHCGSG